MNTIKITCETCGKIHEVRRTNEIPNNVISLGCNWCPDCESKADAYYEEWYNYQDEADDIIPDSEIPNNQLCLPFILDEIFETEIVELELNN